MKDLIGEAQKEIMNRRFQEAEKLLRKITSRDAHNFDALHLLGVVCHENGKASESEQFFQKALSVDSKFPPLFHNYGLCLAKQHRYQAAIEQFNAALKLFSDFLPVYCDRGASFFMLNSFEAALRDYDKALLLKPGLPEAWLGRGNVFAGLRRYDEALSAYDKALTSKPDYAEAHFYKSLVLLLTGHFQQGWSEYEWRKKRHEPIAARSYPQPLWLGRQSIAGKILFIYWEQGFGDTIQFCRYAKLVEAQGAKVVMSVQEPLHGLVKQISPTIEIIGPEQVPTEFDYQCPLMSLPLAFGTTLETIPAEQHCLSVRPKTC